MGRCLRKRKLRKKARTSCAFSDDLKDLYQWVMQKSSRINMSSVTLKTFQDTGRGVMARKAINSGDIIISVPCEYFITTSSISKSPLKSVIERFQTKISPIEALSLFLLHEKFLGMKSEWHPYLEALPKLFSMPMMWKDNELQHLPGWILSMVKDQKHIISKSFQKLKNLLLETCNEFGDKFMFDDFLWAWAVINSRSAYMPQPHEPWLNHEPNNYVLIPFLDMFNHTPSASVVAGFIPTSKCYEIRTNVPFKKYEQVFINYGNHDNVELLINYGFVCPKNPFDSISFTLDEVLTAAKHTCCLRVDVNKKLKFIERNGYNKNMLISREGVSWSLLSTLKVFSAKEIKDDHHHHLLLEEFADEKIVGKVVHYLVSKFRQLPPADYNLKTSSFNIFLANQLCLGFQEITTTILYL